MASKKGIRVNTSDILYQRRPEAAYPVSASDWNRIKQMAKMIKVPNKWCDRIASALIGIAASAFVQFVYSCFQLSENEKWYKGSMLAMLIITIVCMVAGILFFMLDKEKNEAITKGGEGIIQEMENIEGKFICPNEDEGTAL